MMHIYQIMGIRGSYLSLGATDLGPFPGSQNAAKNGTQRYDLFLKESAPSVCSVA